MSEFRDALATLAGRLAHALEQGEASVLEAKDLCDCLVRTGAVAPAVLPGPIVATNPYPAGGPTDSGQAVQAVLRLPGGLGAVWWDTEELCALSAGPPEEAEAEAARQFTPYAECPPLVRAGILAAAPLLSARLVRYLG